MKKSPRPSDDGQIERKVVPISKANEGTEHSRWLESVRRDMQLVLDKIEPPDDGAATEEASDDRDLSDANVVKNERAFRRRFGPGFVWTRLHRTALIHLKNDKDLTDFELRLLHWSGSLKRTLTGVELAAHWWVALFGAFVCCYVGLAFLAIFAMKWPAADGSLRGVFKTALGFGYLSALGLAVYAFYVHPWRIQRRVERQQMIA
jgi:hypothetical protein